MIKISRIDFMIFFGLIIFAFLAVSIYNYLQKSPKFDKFLSTIKLLKLLFKVNKLTKKIKNNNYLIYNKFNENLSKNKDKILFYDGNFLKFEGISYENVEILSNQIAYWLHTEKKVKKNQRICLLMNNSIEYFSWWYAISKLGGISSLLNTSHRGESLLHSLAVSFEHNTLTEENNRNILIVDNLVYDSFTNADIENIKQKNIDIFVWQLIEQCDFITYKSYKSNFSSLNTTYAALKEHIFNLPSILPDNVIENSIKNIKESDTLLYIFTSGTTGKPKACKISHTKFLLSSMILNGLIKMSTKDVLFCPLPLYHSSASLIGLSGTIFSHSSMVLVRKFSVKLFTLQCLAFKVTIFQYIGELCRYLVNNESNDLDQFLHIHTAFGNGMRLEYWNDFKKRYRVKNIVEFYSATEGNVALFNPTKKEGALGYIPRFIDNLYPVKIVKVVEDVEINEENKKKFIDVDGNILIPRSKNGYAEEVEFNEPGLLLSVINTKDPQINRRFEGYTDEQSSEKKILRNLFKEGDAYYNTGDMVLRDSDGYFYWSDRLGDTFRWKGENSSTTQISIIISEILKNLPSKSNSILLESIPLLDLVVVGVSVPGYDGKAGLAVMVLDEDYDEEVDDEGEEENKKKEKTKFNREKLYHLSVKATKLINHEIKKHLPTFSQPLFLRYRSNIHPLPVTSTHKHIRAPIIQQSFHLSKCPDEIIYYRHPLKQQYELLTKDVYDKILNNEIKF